MAFALPGKTSALHDSAAFVCDVNSTGSGVRLYAFILCRIGAFGPKLGLQTWTLRHMTFEQVVGFATANHIKYLQLTSQHLDPNASLEETRRKKGVLDQHGLVAYTFGVNGTSTDKTANRKLFEVARVMGAKVIVVEPAMADWDRLEELVKEYDIKLAIHNHGAGTTYGDRKSSNRSSQPEILVLAFVWTWAGSLRRDSMQPRSFATIKAASTTSILRIRRW